MQESEHNDGPYYGAIVTETTPRRRRWIPRAAFAVIILTLGGWAVQASGISDLARSYIAAQLHTAPAKVQDTSPVVVNDYGVYTYDYRKATTAKSTVQNITGTHATTHEPVPTPAIPIDSTARPALTPVIAPVIAPPSAVAPSIQLSVSAISIQAGSTITLMWSVSNAVSCTSYGFDTHGAPSGSLSLSPTATITYKMVCANQALTTTQQVQVSVQVSAITPPPNPTPPPPIPTPPPTPVPPPAPAPNPAPNTVSTLAELMAAITALPNGGTITLNPGNYGDLVINSMVPTGTLTLTATDSSTAHLDTVRISGSKKITLRNLEIGRPLRSGEPNYLNLISVDGSQDISFSHVYVHGSLDGDPRNDGIGLNVSNSSNILITNSIFEQLYRGAVLGLTSNVDIIGNTFHDLSEDGMDFAQITGAHITNNFVHSFSIVTGAHPDAIQFFTAGSSIASSNITISDNVLIQGAGSVFEGIFMTDQTGSFAFMNILIQNNLIYTQQYNGITVHNGRTVRVINNSVLSSPGDTIQDRIWLKDLSNAEITGNIADTFIRDNVTSTADASNIDLVATPEKATLFPNLAAGANAIVADLLYPGVGYMQRSYGAMALMPGYWTSRDLASAGAAQGSALDHLWGIIRVWFTWMF